MGPHAIDRAESWPVSTSRDLHRDHWVIALREDVVTRPGSPAEEGPFSRLVLEHPGAVVVLALDEDQRVFCLHQYRHAAQRRFVELPAGLCDEAGEDPLDTAKRELAEEAGLAADRWRPLLATYASPGITNELVHIYVAQDLRPVDRGAFQLEHEEADMDTFWVPFSDLHDSVLEGRVTDAPVALAVLAFASRGWSKL
jgi:8-oxo-dGDP phosphatase